PRPRLRRWTGDDGSPVLGARTVRQRAVLRVPRRDLAVRASAARAARRGAARRGADRSALAPRAAAAAAAGAAPARAAGAAPRGRVAGGRGCDVPTERTSVRPPGPRELVNVTDRLDDFGVGEITGSWDHAALPANVRARQPRPCHRRRGGRRMIDLP